MCRHSGEHGLTEQHFHAVAAPVGGPFFQERFLAISQQYEPRFIQSPRVDVRVLQVIGTSAARVDVLRTTLELPVTKDRKADAPVDHVPKVDADILFDRLGDRQRRGGGRNSSCARR